MVVEVVPLAGATVAVEVVVPIDVAAVVEVVSLIGSAVEVDASAFLDPTTLGAGAGVIDVVVLVDASRVEYAVVPRGAAGLTVTMRVVEVVALAGIAAVVEVVGVAEMVGETSLVGFSVEVKVSALLDAIKVADDAIAVIVVVVVDARAVRCL
mmetsp:Transcript_42361/g.107750  ORF Transcript_42361/g.107750 Transcript_42361/m.107750 type:complete len:153 (+) Transcript_42361:180-638(+)|eukprot:CAMPEP_0115462866 /NCGR_PEP_ID=MMETSP0271-20121206/48043_1 /TAXON_ID=71861 /ORGANISM="Scrippsiella trochoidea, Strain CCMP3099" /LENGTH=152 /DNA_ID=CAMNT_0002889663 /DNA_START=171 /DNA_END=629 /DNA_ORIENTATION=+